MAAKKPEYDRIYLQDAVLEKKKTVFFDVETTGLQNEDEIIQFSAISVDFNDWSIKDREEFYINIGRDLPPLIINLTGITDEKLRTEGISREEASKRVASFFEDAVICGHNVSFDIKKTQHLFDMTGNNFDLTALKVVDTLKIARKYIPKEQFGNHKLGTLVSAFHLDEGLSFHNAIDDVIATMRLCHYLYKNYINEYTEDAVFLKDSKKEISADIKEENKVIKSTLPYIPPIPMNDINKETVALLRIARWRKSQAMDRLYITVKTQSGIGKVFFDMHDGCYKDTDGNLVNYINMGALQTAICDVLWDNGFSGFDDFNSDIRI